MRTWLCRLIDRHDHSVDFLPILLGLYFCIAFIAAAIFLGLSLWDVLHSGREFHHEAFGTGLGAIFGLSGVNAIAHAWKWPGGNEPPQGGTDHA